MKIRTLEYFIREAFSSLRRNALMSIASVTTVALSLLILGMFLVLVLNLNNMADALESQIQVTVYLQDSMTDRQVRDMGQQISGMPGVTDVKFVNKTEAMQRFKERLGEQQGLLAALGDNNPLPSSYEVKVDRPTRVKPVAEAIGKLKGVETVKFGQEVIEQLFNLTHLVRVAGLVLIVFLAMAALFIISNTIRITVFARRKEIGIMKYVGATDWFIRWPFMIEGIVLGFGGALIAVVCLVKGYSLVTAQVHETLAFLPLIPKYPFLHNISLILIFVGMIIGALGSTISLKRFMKV